MRATYPNLYRGTLKPHSNRVVPPTPTNPWGRVRDGLKINYLTTYHTYHYTQGEVRGSRGCVIYFGKEAVA